MPPRRRSPAVGDVLTIREVRRSAKACCGDCSTVTLEPTSQDQTAGVAEPEKVQFRVLSPVAIWVAAALIVLTGVGVAVWLLLVYGHAGSDAANQLDAIKTAGTVVVGTGGGAALLLAARRQRSAEIALKQKEWDQVAAARTLALQERVASENALHQVRVAEASEADAAERRITEQYTKAVELLGSGKAPARLGGLYALERLAQNNPDQRQVIIDVICAYLRMPWTPFWFEEGGRRRKSATRTRQQLHRRIGKQVRLGLPNKDVDPLGDGESRDERNEQVVRESAQKILASHLRPKEVESGAEDPNFWPAVRVDLSGATLTNAIFGGCQLTNTSFKQAKFIGTVFFWGAKLERVNFAHATFYDLADFQRAEVGGSTSFHMCKFYEPAWFFCGILCRLAGQSHI